MSEPTTPAAPPTPGPASTTGQRPGRKTPTLKSAESLWYLLAPVFCAATRVLDVYRMNLPQFPFISIISSLFTFCGVAVVLTLLLFLIVRRIGMASALASLLLLLFFTIEELLGSGWYSLSSGATLAYFVVVASIIFLVICLRAKAWPRAYDIGRTWVAGTVTVLFGFSAFQAATYRLPEAPVLYTDDRFAQTTPLPENAPKPDIYHIVLDGYGRGDMYERIYRFSNEPFLSSLRAKGFYVVPQASSNYVQTLLSISSTMEGELVEPGYKGSSLPFRMALANSITQSSSLKRFLQREGYHWAGVETGYGFTEPRAADKVAREPFRYNDFLRTLVTNSPLNRIEFVDQWGLSAHRKLIEYQAATIPTLNRPDQPDYVFTHIICPHAPFVFAGPIESRRLRMPTYVDGQDRTMSYPPYMELYRQYHQRQVEALNSLMMQTVGEILAREGEDVWIILHGDHGPSMRLHNNSAERSDLTERFPILMAIHPPASLNAPPPPDDLSPVNLFVYLLNSQWGTDIKMLQNVHQYSTVSRPGHFVDWQPSQSTPTPSP